MRSNSAAREGKNMANIGQSIIFKGELTGDEDLEIDGQVEGTVHLTNNELTVGPNGHLKAEVNAKSIVVIGRVHGNLTATERIEIQSTGVVEGDIRAPRLLIQEGAVLNGGIDMTKGATASGKSAAGSSPTPPTPPTPPTSGSEEVRKSA
jgi:cytoskeletal protein CcmA (bactofilin family)